MVTKKQSNLLFYNKSLENHIPKNSSDFLIYKTKNSSFKLNLFLFMSLKIYSKNHFFKKNKVNNLVTSYYQLFFKKDFTNFFYNFLIKKNNFLILNQDYSLIYPLYTIFYGNFYLSIYKEFFFLNPVNFTLKNWTYFFYKFLRKNNINLLFIFDYNYYINFYKNLKESDTSVAAIIPYYQINDYIDYPFYFHDCDIFIKLLCCSYIYSILNYSYNYNILYYQYKYIINFYLFSIR